MFAVLRTDSVAPWTAGSLGLLGLFVVAAVLVLLTLLAYGSARRFKVPLLVHFAAWMAGGACGLVFFALNVDAIDTLFQRLFGLPTIVKAVAFFLLCGLVGAALSAGLMWLVVEFVNLDVKRILTDRRIAILVFLRLAALAVVFLLLARPYFASEQEVLNDGQLVLILDYSSSMRITDGPNSLSRWDTLRQLLEAPEVKEALTRLEKDRNLKIHRYMGAEDVRPLDLKNEADGKRTDIGLWLFQLYEKHKNDRNPRALLVLSDGANNGTRYNAVNVANEWRGLRCPIHCLGVGSPNTKKGQRDIAVVSVTTPEMVFQGNKVKVKAVVDAPNMEGQNVTVHLLVEGKEVSKNDNVTLPNTRGNKIDVGEFLADRVGELKVTVKIDEVAGEYTKDNNEMSAFLTVTTKGINILWVEGRKRLEATWVIRHVLSRDARINLVYDERLNDAEKPAADFKGKPYDVVVIGDVGAGRFCGGDQTVFGRLRDQVASRATGLLVLGGFQFYGNPDWTTVGKELTDFLPVDVGGADEIVGEVRPVPTAAGKNQPFLQLVRADIWTELFSPLPGLPKLGPVRPGGSVLLEGQEGKEPVLVLASPERGRVAVFAADTTLDSWYDVEKPEALKAYERFWRQLFVWLARQEEGETQLQLKLDKRRLAAGSNERLGFTVRLLDKQGREVKNPNFQAELVNPKGEKTRVAIGQKGGEYRGQIEATSVEGEYKLVVRASGTGADGKPIEAGPKAARFDSFLDDVENQRPGANHKFLEDVAAAGGGTFRVAGKEELLALLEEVRQRTASPGWVQTDAWPNWKAAPATESPFDQVGALWTSGTLACFVLFSLCIYAEWFLRRLWGWV
jgi:uncharacterized membrane protein